MNRKGILVCLLTASILLETSLFSLAGGIRQAQIVVDLSKTREANPLIFGHNARGADRCRRKKLFTDCINRGELTNFGAGLWNPIEKKPDIEFIKIAQDINIPILRFPGGCGTHHYNWKETIGHLKTRPMFQFGMDEFFRLCKKVGAEPIITLSYFTGTDQDLADIVEYLNFPLKNGNPNGGINWAEARATNGHPDPYNVKYFEFGNEVWHGNHRNIRKVDPHIYARRYLKCQEQFKIIDPNIKLGAVLHSFEFGTLWNSVLIGTLKASMDFAIVHQYLVGNDRNKRMLPSEELFKIALAAPEQAIGWIEGLSKQLEKSAGKKIPIAITEFNSGLKQNKPVPYRHSLGNALVVADMLRTYLTTQAPIFCANYWVFAEGYWGMVYRLPSLAGKKRFYKRPNYYIFEMYSRHFGSRLAETIIDYPSYTSGAFGRVKATIDTAKYENSDPPKVVLSTITPDAWKVRYKPGVKVTKSSEEIMLVFADSQGNRYHHASVTRSIQPTHKYRLSGKIKVEGLTPKAGAFMEVRDIRGRKKTNWSRKTRKVYGTTDWKTFMVVFQPLDDAEAVKILIRNYSKSGIIKGVLRVKNVILEDLGPARKYPATPFLSVIASTNENEEMIYLMVINKHLTTDISARIRIEHFQMAREGKYWTLNGLTIDATNENGKSAVKVSSGTFNISQDENYFEFIFEPHSLSALEIQRGK